MTDGQRAYEARRAAKAGKSLDRWLSEKQRQQDAAAKEEAARLSKAKAAILPKKPGLFARLVELGHQPLKKKT